MGTHYVRLVGLLATAAVMSGCGILPRVAQQTTAAAIAPVANTARAVSKSLEVTSRNIAASAAAAERTSRQVRMTAAQARTTARAVNQRREQFARLASQSRAAKAGMSRAELAAADQQPFDILPEAVLASLTEDQAGLQRAAQKEAFTAPVGEEIYWEDSGRTGTAMAEDETPVGSFLCRTFVQTVRLDAQEERASVFACRSPDGVWEPTLSRTEMAP